jgi:CRP/FNR family cyclic AMP-dependent transcriptional regulator
LTETTAPITLVTIAPHEMAWEMAVNIDVAEAFLEGLPAELRRPLESLATVRTFPAGDVIFLEGAEHRELHVLQSGRVRLDMFVPERGRVPILTLGPGDVLAWSAVLGGGVMTTSAVAVEPIATLAFDGPAVLRLCETEPKIGYHVMRQLCGALSRRLIATRLQLLDLFAEQQVPPVAEMPAAENLSTTEAAGSTDG